MTTQADAFHFAGRVLDAAIAWQQGDRDATRRALQGVPVDHVALSLLTLVDVLAQALSNETGVPAPRLLLDARTQMLRGEHDDQPG